MPGGASIAPMVHQPSPVAVGVYFHVLRPGQFGDIGLHEVCLEVIQHHDAQSWGGCERQHLVHCTRINSAAEIRQLARQRYKEMLSASAG